MTRIDSRPGTAVFRLTIVIILIAILQLTLLDSFDHAHQDLEHQAVLQTKRVIDSSLAVVFASYAVKGRLADLDRLDGANPFELLREFEILVASYRGEIEQDIHTELDSGWYYLKHRGEAVYKSELGGPDKYFRLTLDYLDTNKSDRFEPDYDNFRGLRFIPQD